MFLRLILEQLLLGVVGLSFVLVHVLGDAEYDDEDTEVGDEEDEDGRNLMMWLLLVMAWTASTGTIPSDISSLRSLFSSPEN